MSCNRIVDVSQLSLPEGLESLNLRGNPIGDVEAMSLPAGLRVLILDRATIMNFQYELEALMPDGCELKRWNEL